MGNCFITRRGSIQQGFFPSLFVTGLSEQDTCTATCNGKSFVGEWVTKTVESEEKALIPTMTSNNAPSGYIASGDSTAGTSYAYYLAFDNNISTRWSSSSFGGNKYLQIQLPSAKCVRTIKIKPFLSSDGNTIKDYKIQASNDGSIWVDLHSGTLANGTGNTSGATSEETIEFGNDANYLYYRFYILTSNSTNAYPSIWDIQFYGTEEIEATGFYFPRLTELGTYTVSNGTSTMEILIDAPIEYTLEWSTIPRNGLVAEYLFDGDTLDTSPNGNDLTNNGVTFSNNAGVFSGSAYAQANSGVIPTNSNPFSVSACFKTTSTAEYQTILTNGYLVSDNGFDIRLQNGQVHAFTKGANVLSILSTKTYNDGVWHNVVVTNTGDTTTNGSKMYVDGEFITSGTMSTPITSTVALLVGRTNYSAQYQYFAGSLDNIRIYNRVLTDVEIEALYDEWEILHPRTYLYREGDECTDITGGWSGFSGTGSSKKVGFVEANKIDFSKYSTLNIQYTNTHTSSYGRAFNIGIGSVYNDSGTYATTVSDILNTNVSSSGTEVTTSIDISSVTSQGYLSLWEGTSLNSNTTYSKNADNLYFRGYYNANNDSQTNIYNVWLE